MTGGGLKDNMNMTINNGGAIYVYYKHLTEIDKPMVICIDQGGGTRHWYKAGSGPTNWSDATSLASANPTSLTDQQLDGAGAQNISIPGTTYVIKLDKRPLTASSDKKIKYRTKGIDIEIEKKDENDEHVPSGYVRYTHSFTAINNPIIKHNGFPLDGIDVRGSVTAVYVYYRQNTDDPNHEFPLIVCVKTSVAANIKYYQRGSKWTTIQALTGKDPETISATDLQPHLNGLIDKYEVKLDKTTQYKARPDAADGQISVSIVNPDTEGRFKGFKHDITNKPANRVTIHNHVITEINDFANKNFVFVYFEKEDADGDRNKPLLICLAESESASENNKWYERKWEDNQNKWEDVSAQYTSIKPVDESNQIDEKLKQKLQGITISNDKGYTPLGLVVKLDYAANSNSAPIKYRTGGKQVTVTPISGTSFKGYKHAFTSTVTINKVKIHNIDTGITGTALQDKQNVYVYYAASGDDELRKPYLICLSKDGRSAADPENKWFKRTSSNPNRWENANTGGDYDTIDPGPTISSSLAGKLGPIKTNLDNPGPDTGYPSTKSIVIDASVTPTQTTTGKEALYGWGEN